MRIRAIFITAMTFMAICVLGVSFSVEAEGDPDLGSISGSWHSGTIQALGEPIEGRHEGIFVDHELVVLMHRDFAATFDFVEHVGGTISGTVFYEIFDTDGNLSRSRTESIVGSRQDDHLILTEHFTTDHGGDGTIMYQLSQRGDLLVGHGISISGHMVAFNLSLTRTE
jgi:hypothetical protein